MITEIAALRAQRAALLGFPDHASYVVADRTAGTVEAVASMLGALVGPAVANARDEAAELEAALHADGHEGPLQPWDWAFYAERVKAARFEVDEARLRPYFELQRVLHDGVFRAATALYGITFDQRHDLPVYHPDVTVFDVNDHDGTQLGIFVCDWFARDSKRGGAWMSTFVDQARLLGTRPVVVVNLNVPRPPGDEPALMTSDNVRTAFHEFGHALHGLFSDVTYPRLSGTNVPRDFVEFPSQVNEMWAWWPRGPQRLRPAPRHRRAAAAGGGRRAAGREQLRRGLRHGGVPRRGPAGPRVAPAGARSADAVAVEDVEEFERAALRRHGIDLDVVPPALPQHLLPARVPERVRRGLLLLHLERGARRGPGRVVPRARRAAAQQRRAVPPAAAQPWRQPRTRWRCSPPCAGRGPRIEPLLQRRGLTPGLHLRGRGWRHRRRRRRCRTGMTPRGR